MIINIQPLPTEKREFLEAVTAYLNKLAKGHSIETEFSFSDVQNLYEYFGWHDFYTGISHSPKTPLIPKFIIPLGSAKTSGGGRFSIANLRIQYDPAMLRNMRRGGFLKGAA
jgi:hypothetical protein